MAAAKSEAVELEVGERTVRISSPDRVYFSARGETKLDLADYYVSVGDGIVRALRERPCMLHRFPSGVDGEKVHQKRVPNGAPPWLQTVRITSRASTAPRTSCASPNWPASSGRCRCPRSSSIRGTRAAPTSSAPTSGASTWTRCPTARSTRVRRVAHTAHEVLDEIGAVGWPKTSGGHGIHIYVRIAPEHGFGDVRRAALAFAREVERRAPADATTTWWRKDRAPDKVFVDYNQNARDHTIASAYSVRGKVEGTVSAPITWEEIDDVQPQDLTIATMPERFARLGDLHAGIDDAVFSLAPLLEWAERDERAGEEAPPEPDDEG